MDDVADGQIAESIAGSGPDSLGAEAALCRRFAPRIRLYGLRHLGDEHSAADLVQQVLVSVLQSLRDGRLESPNRLGGFVLGTCRHIVAEMRRAERRQRAIAAEMLAFDLSAPPPAWSEVDVMRLRSNRALARCPRTSTARDSVVTPRRV